MRHADKWRVIFSQNSATPVSTSFVVFAAAVFDIRSTGQTQQLAVWCVALLSIVSSSGDTQRVWFLKRIFSRLLIEVDATLHIRRVGANGAANFQCGDFWPHVYKLAGLVEDPPISVPEGWIMHRISVVPVLAYLQLWPAESGRVLGAPVGIQRQCIPSHSSREPLRIVPALFRH